MLAPRRLPLPGPAEPPPPAGREVVRAYVAFVAETTTRIEQADGDISGMHAYIGAVRPHMLQHAPEYAAQLSAPERASRRPDQPTPPLHSFAEINATYGARQEERVKLARRTKDPLGLEMAASAAMSRKEFDEARDLVASPKEGGLKSRLSEQANARESQHLLGAGDLAGAERLARRLHMVSSLTRVCPPLVRRLAKEADAGRARSAAARLEDRLQRLSALASVCRGEAGRMGRRGRAAKAR